MPKNFKNIRFLIYLVIVSIISANYLIAEEKTKISGNIIFGKETAPIKIKVFSSLTRPHCANFHINILPKIKEQFIDQGKVQLTHIDFPLDLAALNAGKLLHCIKDKDKQIKILDKIYNNQSTWVSGTTIEEINENLINLFKNFNVDKNQLNTCLNDENIEEVILENRVKAHNNYKLNSTPTVIINEKKFEEDINFKNIEKTLKKLI